MTDDEANEAFDPEKNYEAAFDAEVRPLMSKVLEVCRAKGIPFLAVFQVAEDVFFEYASIPGSASPLLRSIDNYLEEARDALGALN